MKILQITLNVPIIDLDEDERQSLLDSIFGDDDPEGRAEGLPTLADYIKGEDQGGQLIAETLACYLDQETDGEMWAGSEIYIQIDKSVGVTVDKADWLPDVQPIDPTTGRPFGDHGEGHHAIRYALEEIEDHYDVMGFLNDWSHGDLKEWPEFYPWLKAHE